MKKLISILLFLPLLAQAQIGDFVCGFEEGIFGTGTHWQSNSGTSSISTSTVRSGARSLRCNPTASTGYGYTGQIGTGGTTMVARFYIRFTSLPLADVLLCNLGGTSNGGIFFKFLDSKLYSRATSSSTVSTNGVSVTTGQWYRIDCLMSSVADPWTLDVSINGTALDQVTVANSPGALNNLTLGARSGTNTFDIFYDDVLITSVSGDYPLGDGNVYAYTVSSDGTHNVAGSADFKRGAGGSDILNATTDAYLLVDDIPFDAVGSAPTTDDYISAIAPPNSTDYTENKFGVAPSNTNTGTAPRMVSITVETAQAATQSGSFKLNLVDNATTSVITEQAGVAGVTTVKAAYASFKTPPSGGSWNNGSSGNGAFYNIRIRFYSADAAPDQYFVATLAEADFVPDNATVPGTPGDKRLSSTGVGLTAFQNYFPNNNNLNYENSYRCSSPANSGIYYSTAKQRN